MMNYGNLSRNRLEMAYLAKQELSRRNLADYADYIGKVSPAQHHLILIRALESVERGDIKRLMVFMPPGHAKSMYSSILFPAWYIGRNPKNSIITASYSATLSERFGRKVRDQVGSKYYPFTDVKLSESTKSKGEWETNQGGEYFAAGVGTGITGRRADLGLIDDPIKGREDADSIVIRDKTWEWYLSDFRTRLKPDAPIVIIQTRWHEDDLAGRILPETYNFASGLITARDGEQWYIINLPALAEDNDFMHRALNQPLWPEMFSAERLNQERITQGLRNWTSLYQQRPSPESGNYFLRDWIQYYTDLPSGLNYYGASDYAVTKNDGDYTEHGIMGLNPDDNIYIADWWFGQESPDVWIDAKLDLVQKWATVSWGVEKGQIEKSIEPFLRKRMAERGVYVYIIKIASTLDKPTRAQAFRGRMAQKKVFFPKNATWDVDRLLRQLLAFPAGVYDDAVDVLGLFGRMLMDMSTARPQPPVDTRPKPKDLAIFADMLKREKDPREFWR